MGSSLENTWISRHCGLKENELLCEVNKSYIQNRYNLNGLKDFLPASYSEALDLITDKQMEVENKQGPYCIEEDAKILYGLIHSRYVLTERGMAKMMEKYKLSAFGLCRKVHCQSQALLPLGLSDIPMQEVVNFYCPKCRDVFGPEAPSHRHTDGAYFGTAFPHLFLMNYPECTPNCTEKKFEEQLFGFKIHPSAYALQEEASSATRPCYCNPINVKIYFVNSRN